MGLRHIDEWTKARNADRFWIQSLLELVPDIRSDGTYSHMAMSCNTSDAIAWPGKHKELRRIWVDRTVLSPGDYPIAFDDSLEAWTALARSCQGLNLMNFSDSVQECSWRWNKDKGTTIRTIRGRMMAAAGILRGGGHRRHCNVTGNPKQAAARGIL